MKGGYVRRTTREGCYTSEGKSEWASTEWIALYLAGREKEVKKESIAHPELNKSPVNELVER